MKHIIALIFTLIPLTGHTAATCEITDFAIQGDENGAVYLRGNLSGNFRGWISLCGASSGETNCASPATDRRLQIALKAISSNMVLMALFENLTKCSDFENHMRVTLLTLKK